MDESSIVPPIVAHSRAVLARQNATREQLAKQLAEITESTMQLYEFTASILRANGEKDKQLIELRERLAEVRGERYYPPRQGIPKAIREEVFERDRKRCVYCGAAVRVMHIDHVQPVSRGGTNDPRNLVTCCPSCNSLKGSKTLEELNWKPVRITRA